MVREVRRLATVAPRSRGVSAYLQLLRPPNLVTAAADILAGTAAAGLPASPATIPLVGSSMALYAGGVVLNDFFDRRLDAMERPERPIPSGQVRPLHAAALGYSLLGAGIAGALSASPASGAVAAATACCVLSYDAWAKRYAIVGPLTMGLCRGFNLLLGLSAAPAALAGRWPLGLLPVAYVAAITALSAGEVKGGSKRSVLSAALIVCAVCGAILLLGVDPAFRWGWAAPVVLFLGYRVLPAMGRAYRDPVDTNIRGAVKAGVLSLIVLDAAVAAGYGGPWFGAGVLALLGLAAALAGLFAVT